MTIVGIGDLPLSAHLKVTVYRSRKQINEMRMWVHLVAADRRSSRPSEGGSAAKAHGSAAFLVGDGPPPGKAGAGARGSRRLAPAHRTSSCADDIKLLLTVA